MVWNSSWSYASIAFEDRPPLRDEGLVGAREVAGQHAQRLGLRLGLDRLLERHGPLLMQHRLGDAVREGRAGREIACERLRRGQQLAWFAEPVEEAPALGLVAAHR